LVVEMLDYMTDEVVWQSEYELDTYSLKENVVTVKVPTADVQVNYVYFRVKMGSEATSIFSYDTKILKFTEIM
ncbi:MAG: hypothetical protein H5T94_02340, partial [Pseudothermotoga sp.]|nr:hypothetical protein [Pseudothermotoga sp.]